MPVGLRQLHCSVGGAELVLVLTAMERGARGNVPMETALTECKEAVEAYRACKAA